MIIEQGSTQSKLVKIFNRNLFANLGRKLPEPIGDIKIPIEVSNRNNAPILQASPVQTPNMPGKTDLSKKIFQNIGFLKNSDVTKFGVGDVKNILSVPLLDSKTDTIQLPSNVDLTKFNLPNINLPKTDSLVQSSVATISNLSTEPLINSKIDSQVGDCKYLVYVEGHESLKLYSIASSKRMAFLKLEKHLDSIGVTWFSTSRTRVFVELVGVPITNQELKDKLPKYKEDQEIEK